MRRSAAGGGHPGRVVSCFRVGAAHLPRKMIRAVHGTSDAAKRAAHRTRIELSSTRFLVLWPYYTCLFSLLVALIFKNPNEIL